MEFSEAVTSSAPIVFSEPETSRRMVASPEPFKLPPVKTFADPESVTLVYELPLFVAAPVQCGLI